MINDIALVSVTYNSAHLANWFAHTAKNFSNVIIVDNSSDDETTFEFKNKLPHATIISEQKNLGFGTANNRGFQQAVKLGLKYVLFINPDCKIEEANVLKLQDTLLNDIQLGIAFPLVHDPEGRKSEVLLCDFSKPYAERSITRLENYFFDGVIKSACLEGSCFMARTEDLQAINGFNNDIFMYCEEDDLGLRLRKINKFIGIDLKTKAIHLGGASTRPSWSLAVRKAYHVRWSRFYMTDRYISKKKRKLEVAKALLSGPFALIFYSLAFQKKNLVKWSGWWLASIDGVFMSKFFRRFMS